MRFWVRSLRPRNPLVRIFRGPPPLPKAPKGEALFGEADAFCARRDSCARSP